MTKYNLGTRKTIVQNESILELYGIERLSYQQLYIDGRKRKGQENRLYCTIVVGGCDINPSSQTFKTEQEAVEDVVKWVEKYLRIPD